MTPYASGKRWTLYAGDCISVLSQLPAASVDAVVTDPPYSSGGAFRGDRMMGTNAKYLSSDSAQKTYLPQFAGDNRDQRAYLTWCSLWLSAALVATKEGAPIVCFTDWRQLPTTTDAIQVGGWTWRGIAPWIKSSSRPQMGRIGSAAEFAVWGTAGPSLDLPEVGCLPGYFIENSPRGDERVHVTQKPVGVMAWLVGLCRPGGTVLDPFTGSGSTGVAALETGRSFVGIETEPAYLDVAARRLEQAESDGQQAPLFGGTT